MIFELQSDRKINLERKKREKDPQEIRELGREVNDKRSKENR